MTWSVNNELSKETASSYSRRERATPSGSWPLRELPPPLLRCSRTGVDSSVASAHSTCDRITDRSASTADVCAESCPSAPYVSAWRSG